MKRFFLSAGSGIALFFLLSNITMTLENWFGYTSETATPFHLWLFLPFYIMQGAIPFRDALDFGQMNANAFIFALLFHFVVFSVLSFWLLGKLPAKKRAV